MLIAAKPLHRMFGLSCGERSKLSLSALRSARGKSLRVGSDCIINARLSFDRADAQISIGDRCYIGASHLVAASGIAIGDDVVISWGVTIVDHNSHATDWPGRRNDILDWHHGKKDWSGVAIAPATIERRCWIGFNAIILKGVTLGEGAVVGAGAVVTKSVAPYTVVAGNPARPIRELERPDG